jgi:hypothetical protein
MTDEPIDFEAARGRRVEAGIDADQAHWQDVHDRLFQVMVTSGLSDISLTSAALRALLDVLVADGKGLSLDDAKDRVSRSARAFF